MTNYDEQLQQLRQKVSRKQHLEKLLAQLRPQREELIDRVNTLEAAKLSEQADVDRLEGRSLAAFFYNVVGKMDQRLDKKRQEAYAAAVKFDAAVRELAAVEDDIDCYEAELKTLQSCQAQYDKLLAAKAAAVKASGSDTADEILALEARIAYLEDQMDEVDEAIAAGKRALNSARAVLDSLNSAEDWGTWDMLGGGLMADIAKHSRLDDAQRKVEVLQVELRRFKTELADVSTIQVTMQVNVDGFLRFADYFFDNLFTDWAVMDKISQSKDQVSHTVRQISSVLQKLDSMMARDQEEWSRSKAQINELVLKARL